MPLHLSLRRKNRKSNMNKYAVLLAAPCPILRVTAGGGLGMVMVR